MRNYASLVAAALVVLLVRDADASLAGGKSKFIRGDYSGARAEFSRVRGKDRPEAELFLARIDVRVGRYEAAEKQAQSLTAASDVGVAGAARVLLAEIYRTTGRYQAARRELEPMVAAQSDQLRARYILGLVYRDLGQIKRSEPLFEMFFSDWNAGKIKEDDAEALFYVAEAARYLSAFEDANNSFRDAVRLDGNLLEANLRWGDFGLEKYAVGLAEQSFDEVLKIDAHHPDAHNGMARVKLEQNYDLAAALHHLGKALAVNPKHIPSLRTRASVEIDQNQWDAAKATLAEVFAVNPSDFRGRALLATIHWLRDDLAAYEAERRRVLAANPAFAEFFHIVARSAVREHRYKEAIALEHEAIKVDPKYYEAMGAVGTGYLRLGEEKRGLEWLRKSWEGDEYNVRTYNTLNLFEEEIPKQYSFVQSKYFKFRYPNQEKAILRRYIEPLLERAFEDMVARYGFRPRTPIVIELFRDPQHYSVRTVGLPNLGALGVCFGQVITAMSPTVGDINWSMVLWHELAHVFAIQLSNSRVPRWYTEGLSEYETIIARPEWRREHDADVYAALQAGKLPSVAELNYYFMKPSMQQVVVAYYLSALTIEYIVQNHGFARVVEGLKLFGQGVETAQVIERITGQTVAEFDAAFRAQLETRLAPYRGTFRLPTDGYDDVKKLATAASARPDDVAARAALALGHYYDGNAAAARAAADDVLAVDAGNKIALYVSAEIALRARDADTAEKRYRELIDAGGDSYDVRGRLAMIARQRGDVAEAEAQLCAAKKLDPERAYPYMELFEIYSAAGRDDEALAELETYVMIEQMQYGPIKQLVDAYAAKKRWAEVRAYGELAVNINLTDAALFLALGTGYLETGAPDRALFAFDSALLVTPRLRRPALAHIGRARAFLAKKQRRKARAEVKKALAIEPENAAALALKKQLR
ncbi:MAG: tetratricopeptide repeat protein [Proteobacteria bacterium]|nr:tetratricopeptide repeat protein [Pseudomonadota bacterium]